MSRAETGCASLLVVVLVIAALAGIIYLSIAAQRGAGADLPVWIGVTGDPTAAPSQNAATPPGSPVQVQVLQPARTLWDWMQLLLIPVVLTFGVVWLNRLEKERDEYAQAQRAKEGREIEARRESEAVLQSYFDQMTYLLLEKNLRNSRPDDEVRGVARARTLTALRRLDPTRQQFLIRFLGDSGLLERSMQIIDLVKADLKGVDLSRANLRDIDLSQTNLRNAKLIKADLVQAILFKADLNEANFSGADMNKVDMREASLHKANLQKATLREANLRGANLHRADLRGADLSKADLTDANLDGADLRSSNLKAANLTGVALRGASVKLPLENITSVLFGNVRLDFADLSEVILVDSDLRRARLIGLDLSGAILCGADLTKADLTGVKLINADLTDATLIDTIVTGTDLSGATLTNCRITRAQLATTKSHSQIP